MSNLKQSWNSRSKKWVLFEPGAKANIIGMRPSKFPGIDVEKDKPENISEDEKDHSESPEPVEETKEQSEESSNNNSSENSGFWL